MSDQPKPATDEWTCRILDELGTRLPAGYHFGQLVADAHNAALAAERNEWIVANRDLAIRVLSLQNQLAAAQKPLVELLSLLRYDANGHITAWPNEKKFKAALAKVKETT